MGRAEHGRQPFGEFELVGFESKSPSYVESVEPTYTFQMKDGSMIGWMIVTPRESYAYACRWKWQRD